MNQNKKQIEFEDWFREHWEEMKDEDLIYQVRSHAYNFSESFLREFKDVLGIDYILLNIEPSIDFLREFFDEYHYWFSKSSWNEKTIEEFKKKVDFGRMIESNFNISDEFINKWREEVTNFDKVIIERNQNRYRYDPEYRKLVNEELQLLQEIGLDVY